MPDEISYWERALRKRMSRRGALKAGAGAGFGLAALSLVGCPQQQQQRAEVSTEKQPKAGGIHRYRQSSDPPHLDPHGNGTAVGGQFMGMVYSRLVRYKSGAGVRQSDDTVVPDLAEKWEQPDPTTHVFSLRKGVKFHDVPPVNGRELEAQDVKYSFERIFDPKINVQWSTYYSAVKAVTAVDKYTVKFTTTEPFAPFYSSLAHSYTPWIVAREAVEKFGDLKKNGIGTGPFLSESYDRNVKMVFKKNPNYFLKDRPYLDSVVWLFIPDASTAKAGFIAGEVDTGSVQVIELEEIKKAVPDAVQEKGMPTTYACLNMNLKKPPFNEVKVRQAIKYALDYQRMIDTLYKGDALYGGLIAPLYEGWVLPQDELKKQFKPDLAKAKQLMAEAGYPDGFKSAIQTTAAIGGDTTASMAQMIAQDLKQIGIQLEHKTAEYAKYIADRTAVNYDMLVGAARMGTDPNDYTYDALHPKGSRNFSGFDDPKMNVLLEKQRGQSNQTERKKTVDEIQRLYAELVPEIPVPQGYSYSFNRGYLKGFALTHEFARVGVVLGLWLDK